MPATALIQPAHQFPAPEQAAGYVANYFGVWAIEETAANGLLGVARNMDMSAHLGEVARKIESIGAPITPLQKMMADATVAADIAARLPTAEARPAGPKFNGIMTVDGVAVIVMRGPMMKFTSSMGGGVSTSEARRSIRLAASDASVRAILLLIDSPGGTVSGTADLADDISAAGQKKPVWAYAEDLMASAAYWAGSQAERIGTGRSALVGSLGTMMALYDWSKAFDKAGVEAVVFKTGTMKAAGVQGAEITDEQRKRFQSMVDDLNTHFRAAVEGGRPGANTKVAFADAQVYSADRAKELGLVDDITSLDAFYSDLVKSLDEADEKAGSTASARAIVAADKEHAAAALAEAIPTPAAAGENAVMPLTIAALRAALPGASNDFLLKQMESPDATIETAAASYLKTQNDTIAGLQLQLADKDKVVAAKDGEIAALNTKVTDLQAKIDAGHKNTSIQPIGQQPAGSQGDGAGGGGAPVTDKQKAEAEWDANTNNCQNDFLDKATYAGFREADLKGQVKAQRVGR